MKISNLKENPHLIQETLTLIEASFEYDKKHSFYKDFYPLIKESNHEHCYILIQDNRVLGHLGVLKGHLQIEKKYSFAMFGGIAVDKNYRGMGLFKKLFQQVLPLYQDNAFLLLWSDQINLYSPFGFYPCGELKQYKQSHQAHSYTQKKFSQLSQDEKDTISSLYHSTNELRPTRTAVDWETLFTMDTVDLYLKVEKNKIKNYFLKNKGQDLTDIIHEYGEISSELIQAGTLWTPEKLNASYVTLNAFQLKPGSYFKHFIEDYADISIKSIGKQTVFEFNGESYELATEDFLQGVFGPGRFDELDLPYLYIPGATSI